MQTSSVNCSFLVHTAYFWRGSVYFAPVDSTAKFNSKKSVKLVLSVAALSGLQNCARSDLRLSFSSLAQRTLASGPTALLTHEEIEPDVTEKKLFRRI